LNSPPAGHIEKSFPKAAGGFKSRLCDAGLRASSGYGEVQPGQTGRAVGNWSGPRSDAEVSADKSENNRTDRFWLTRDRKFEYSFSLSLKSHHADLHLTSSRQYNILENFLFQVSLNFDA